jgi:hypothetical protein
MFTCGAAVSVEPTHKLFSLVSLVHNVLIDVTAIYKHYFYSWVKWIKY